MNSAWNLPELQKWITANRPESARAVEMLSSLDRSSKIFNYHMWEARDAFNDFKDDTDHLKMTMGIFSAGDDDAFTYATVVSEANLIACINVIRNAYDIFAQVINVLVLDNVLATDKCNVGEVTRRLQPSSLCSCLASATSSDWYDYLSDFSNTVKHRQLMKHSASVSFEESISGGKVAGFRYQRNVKGKHSDVDRVHPPYWVNDVLRGAIEVHNEINVCGRALNALLLPEGSPAITVA